MPVCGSLYSSFLPRELGVLGEVEVAAVGDALELRPADRVQVLDVAGGARVVRELLRGVRRAGAGARGRCRAACTSPGAPGTSTRTTAAASSGGTKNSISICSNSSVRKMKFAGRDLVAERLADLRDAERRLLARERERRLEVEEDALRGLGAQVDGRALLLDRPDRRLEHQVERARLGQVAAADRALDGLRVLAAGLGLLLQRVQRGSAACTCPGTGRAGRRSPRGGPEASHVRGCWMIAESSATTSSRSWIIACHHASDDVALEQDAVVPVVVGVGDAAVDLGGGEDQAAALAERDDLVEGGCGHRTRV